MTIEHRYVRKVGRKWYVYSKAGKILGRHETKESAMKQLGAVEASKSGKGRDAWADGVRDAFEGRELSETVRQSRFNESHDPETGQFAETEGGEGNELFDARERKVAKDAGLVNYIETANDAQLEKVGSVDKLRAMVSEGLRKSGFKGEQIELHRGLALDDRDIAKLRPGATLNLGTGAASFTDDPKIASSFALEAKKKEYGRQRVVLSGNVPLSSIIGTYRVNAAYKESGFEDQKEWTAWKMGKVKIKSMSYENDGVDEFNLIHVKI